MFIFSFKKCESELEVKRVKKVYLVIFIGLFIIPFIIVSITVTKLLLPIYEVGLGEGNFVNIEERIEAIRPILFIIGFISFFIYLLLFYITIWACLKLGMEKILSILWGIVALLPLISFVTLIVILSQKPTFIKQI